MTRINIHHLLVFMILIAFNLNINAQSEKLSLIPDLSISYGNYKFGVREPETGKRYDYALPNFKVHTGLEIKRGAISAYYSTDIYCKLSGRVFSPEQATFEIGGSYQINKNISISVSHACLHPLRSDTEYNSKGGIFGGWDEVTVKFRFPELSSK